MLKVINKSQKLKAFDTMKKKLYPPKSAKGKKNSLGKYKQQNTIMAKSKRKKKNTKRKVEHKK